MKKIMKNTRLQLLILAVSLLITTTVLGLSAYLNDQASYSTTFTVKSEEDFDISITAKPLSESIVYPNQIIALNPTVHNDGLFAAYLFADIQISDIFDVTIDEDKWRLMEGDVNNGIYYYGDSSLTSFNAGSSTALFDNVTISSVAEKDSTGSIAITVYAIQTSGYDASEPEQVWADAQTAEP